MPSAVNTIPQSTYDEVHKVDEAGSKNEVEVDENYENIENRVQTASSKGSLDN